MVGKQLTDPFEDFVAKLGTELSRPLPGRDAQYLMAPRPRSGAAGRYDQPAENARQGSVLALFYPHNSQTRLPLILRPTYSGVHSGQVGLPGGGHEEIDRDLAATALREAYEEIGVHPKAVNILGHLSPLYVYASNYLVHPVVGWTAARPDFRIDPYEVARLIEANLGDFFDPNNRVEEEWQLRDRVASVPFYRIDGEAIWGATAMILSELFSLQVFRALMNG